MDFRIQAILLGMLLFSLYILLPIIPAILIYKLFPNEKISAEGLLGKLKINATGAFAGYLIILSIGHFLIPEIQEMIIGYSKGQDAPWLINSKVVLEEKTDDTYRVCSRINHDSIKSRLEIRTTPDYYQKDLNAVTFSAYYRPGASKITFTYPNFESAYIDLSKDSGIVFDKLNGTINLGIIKLKEQTQAYAPPAIGPITLITGDKPTVGPNGKPINNTALQQ